MAKTTLASPSATRLSGLRSGVSLEPSHLYAMARLSLSVLLVSMLSGCLIEDPPPLHKAQQTPPWLDYHGARPFRDQVLFVRRNENIQFTVPVRSEDAGEGLTGVLVLDYLAEEQPVPLVIAPYSNLPPSTLDDPLPREFKLTWLVRADPGCHRVTLLAGHTSTIGDQATIVDSRDLAVADWWVNVDVTPENSNVLLGCPEASRPAPAERQ